MDTAVATVDAMEIGTTTITTGGATTINIQRVVVTLVWRPDRWRESQLSGSRVLTGKLRLDEHRNL
jgi:hypothetical protein